MPSGPVIRWRTRVSKSTPARSASAWPSRPAPRFEYSWRSPISLAAEEGLQVLGGEVGVGIAAVGHRHVVGQARQAGGVSGQVDQGDLAPAALRHGDAGGQIVRDRVVQRRLAAPGHVGQQQGGEHLGDRADLEDGVGIDAPAAAAPPHAMGDNAPPAGVHDADDDADATLLHVDALGEDGGDGFVGRNLPGRVGHRLRLPLSVVRSRG
jgi:hypothetical protein